MSLFSKKKNLTNVCVSHVQTMNKQQIIYKSINVSNGDITTKYNNNNNDKKKDNGQKKPNDQPGQSVLVSVC